MAASLMEEKMDLRIRRTNYRTMMDGSGTTYFFGQPKAEITAQMLQIMGDSGMLP